MRIGIPKEIFPTERRVAGTPRTVKRLSQAGFQVRIERGAGEEAEHPDAEYAEVGGELVDDVEALWRESDIVLKVRPPMYDEEREHHEADLLREGACLIGFIWPADNEDLLERLAKRRVSTIAMDRVPRITRAQKVDALSAMANAAGYRAVIEAASHYPRFLAGQTTAAGSIKPATVLIIGAGVAGLAAIGAARGLGAIVRAFDTRPEVGEQVRSMGAEFLELEFEEDASGEGGYAKVMSDAFIKAEMKMFAQQAMEVNIIITTALIPGKDAPKLITAGMVESMREGSVIVDLAAQQGGNCTLTKPGEVVHHHGVRIIGYTDLPSRMAIQTSWLYGSTLVNMIEEMGGAEAFTVDTENEIISGSLVTHEGRVHWPPPPKPPAPEESAPQPWNESKAAGFAVPPKKEKEEKKSGAGLAWLGVAAAAIVAVGWGAPASFLGHLTVFVLACFVGWQVVWNVTPALHTPLISITNAISGIIILGGMLHLSGGWSEPATLLAFVAVLIAAINICGGFLVTRRMLAMFRR
ncbi:MAG: Re/Si-specific NAD(P)(+) transhydrogenase subunit alpha [Gemmatimonadota bacterium]